MSHHTNDNPFFGRDDDDDAVERASLRRKLLDTTGFKGATGMFPDGQLTQNDEGGLRFGLSVLDGKVCVDFATPVRSLGMTPQQACDFASDLIKIARAAAREKGETVGFMIR